MLGKNEKIFCLTKGPRPLLKLCVFSFSLSLGLELRYLSSLLTFITQMSDIGPSWSSCLNDWRVFGQIYLKVKISHQSVEFLGFGEVGRASVTNRCNRPGHCRPSDRLRPPFYTSTTFLTFFTAFLRRQLLETFR